MDKKLLSRTIIKIKYGKLIYALEVIAAVVIMFLAILLAGGTYPY